MPASVVEVHVAARRLRRIVPLGIRPNGTIPLRGERPSSGSTRSFESSPGVFIMRKAVAAIRRRNTLSAVPLAIQKPAGQANNPAYRRLQCFFVLTKGMSVVGPRPALPNEVATYNDYQRQRLLVKPGMTCYWQTCRNRDSITFDEWVDLDLWQQLRVLHGRDLTRAKFSDAGARGIYAAMGSESESTPISSAPSMPCSDGFRPRVSWLPRTRPGPYSSTPTACRRSLSVAYLRL